MNDMDANAVIKAAQKIADRDFRVTISRYVTGPQYPWMITVGESSWDRRFIVKKIFSGGEDAELDLLSKDESKVECTIMLQVLVRDSYTGVKRLLWPATQAAA